MSEDKSESTAVAVQSQSNMNVALSPEELQKIAVDFNSADLPSLADARTVDVPLDIAYWTPEEGEIIKCWILGVEETQVPDITTGELKPLLCVFFVVENENKERERFMNGSKPLVGKIEAAILRGEIIPKTKRGAVEIQFLGTKKNKRNNFNSHNWKILPLVFG